MVSTKIQNFIKDNWLITLIIIAATLLRTWDIGTRGILFSDAGRDLRVAQASVETQQLPLVGISSSIPRFHQGPVTIWIEMLIYLAFGHQTIAFSVIFAFFGVLAVIAVYEYCVVYINKKTALIAATILSFSPLAIAHSRVPYHTNPIPLVIMIYLFALQYLWQNKKLGLFWAGLGWILVMQFELNLFSLGLIIPYILWRKKIKLKLDSISQLSAAMLIGLLPQIVYDLSHSFGESQLGGFMLWISYRLASFTGAVGNHRPSFSSILETLSLFKHYGGRIFSTQSDLILYIFLGIFIFTIIKIIKNQRKINIGLIIPSLALVLLTSSYFVHGSPSEAYFPPYFPLLSIFIGWGISEVFNKQKIIVVIGLVVWSGINTLSIIRHNFFVSNPQSFSYGASILEQQQIMRQIYKLSGGNYRLATTHPAGKFDSYFDNYFWLMNKSLTAKHQKSAPIFYIEPKDSALSGYPDIISLGFTTYDVYHR